MHSEKDKIVRYKTIKKVKYEYLWPSLIPISKAVGKEDRVDEGVALATLVVKELAIMILTAICENTTLGLAIALRQNTDNLASLRQIIKAVVEISLGQWLRVEPNDQISGFIVDSAMHLSVPLIETTVGKFQFSLESGEEFRVEERAAFEAFTGGFLSVEEPKLIALPDIAGSARHTTVDVVHTVLHDALNFVQLRATSSRADRGVACRTESNIRRVVHDVVHKLSVLHEHLHGLGVSREIEESRVHPTKITTVRIGPAETSLLRIPLLFVQKMKRPTVGAHSVEWTEIILSREAASKFALASQHSGMEQWLSSGRNNKDGHFFEG